MRALVGFLLGYYLGSKDGPERLSQWMQSAQDIASSPELQKVRSSIVALAEQTLGHLERKITAPQGSGAASMADAWKAISESAEFRELLATGATLLQVVLSTVVPQDQGDRHAPQ